MSSPIIKDLQWGRVAVEGARAVYKDAKLWPGGSRKWDWNETGTRHKPGVQPADLEEILNQGVDHLVISRGMDRVLQVPQSTIDFVQSKGVQVVVAQTEEARDTYNQLAKEGKRVGGVFHSTC